MEALIPLSKGRKAAAQNLREVKWQLLVYTDPRVSYIVDKTMCK